MRKWEDRTTACAAISVAIFATSCEAETQSLLARSPPVIEEPTPPDHDLALTELLAGTYWTSRIEGSIGSYLTWYAFLPDGQLQLTEELRPAFEHVDPEFSAGGRGRWVVRDMLVELEWEGDRWAPGERRYTARWAFAPSGDALASALYAELRAEDGDAWSETMFNAVDGDPTRFRGEWHFSTEDIERRAIERHGRSVEVRFDRGLDDPRVSSVLVEIEPYVGRDGTESRDRRRFEWTCSVEQIAETSLTALRIDGFAGDRWSIRNAWSAELSAEGVRDDIREEMIQAFIPSLIFDASDPTRVASLPLRPPLLTRQLEIPPEVAGP